MILKAPPNDFLIFKKLMRCVCRSTFHFCIKTKINQQVLSDDQVNNTEMRVIYPYTVQVGKGLV